MSTAVKSAVRVLEVLEHFDSIQREASVTELARDLGYPVSSTSVLLKCLAESGYLEQDASRMYHPTPRVSLLGAWIDPLLAPGGPIVQMMNELGVMTGETIILAVPLGMTVRYISVVPATKTVRMHVGPGTTRPLLTSGFGRLFLAGMSAEKVRQNVFRFAAQQIDKAACPSLAAVRRDVQAIRMAGHAISMNRVTQGAGVVAVPLPKTACNTPMAVGIGSSTPTIRAHGREFAAQIKHEIRRVLGS